MGIGKDEQAALLVAHLLEVVEVHLVSLQRVPHHFALVPSGCEEEGVIDGWLHNDLCILFQEEVDDHADALHDARDVGEPFTFHVPLVVVLNPSLHRLPILLGLDGVAKQRVLQPRLQGIGDEGGRFPIHVSHPQRQEITPSISFLKHLMLQIARPSAVNRLVKIVVHNFQFSIIN